MNQTIEQLSKISLVYLSDKDKVEFEKELELVLKWAQDIFKVDCKDISDDICRFRLPDSTNTVRRDTPKKNLSITEIRTNAPQMDKNGFFVIPKIEKK